MRKLSAVLLAVPLCAVLLFGILGDIGEFISDYLFFHLVGINTISLQVVFTDDPFLYSYALTTVTSVYLLVQLRHSVGKTDRQDVIQASFEGAPPERWE